ECLGQSAGRVCRGAARSRYGLAAGHGLRGENEPRRERDPGAGIALSAGQGLAGAHGARQPWATRRADRLHAENSRRQWHDAQDRRQGLREVRRDQCRPGDLHGQAGNIGQCAERLHDQRRAQEAGQRGAGGGRRPSAGGPILRTALGARFAHMDRV
ncbi:hypothetical protein, partial [Pseudomonas sp. FEN]